MKLGYAGPYCVMSGTMAQLSCLWRTLHGAPWFSEGKIFPAKTIKAGTRESDPRPIYLLPGFTAGIFARSAGR